MGTLVITNDLSALTAGDQPLSKLDQNFTDIVNFINGGNLNVDNVPDLANKEPALGNPSSSGDVLSSTTGGTRSWVTKEDYLGVPAQDGYVLSSTTGGVRSWIDPAGPGAPFTNRQVFVSSGTWSWSGAGEPSKVYIQLWGAGGGGANNGGGGGGAYADGIFGSITGDITVTVGTGGSAGAAGTKSEVSGGGIPSAMTANGGSGGSGTGGNGGTTSGVPANGNSIKGGKGDDGLNAGGRGGSSPQGGAGGGEVQSSTGNAGIEPGGGGGGGDGTTGGAGAKGRVVIWW